MKRLGEINVPLPLVALVILMISAIGVAGAIYYREVVFSYRFVLSDGQKLSQEFHFGSWPALANADFFRNVRNQLVSEGASFIEADLSAMQLTVYDRGLKMDSVPILTKGKEGSWWETPAGLYKIEGKENNHFSAFAGVFLPWSLPFQGNFFIHGWPYYADGKPVESRYSGGCIRLSTDDAKKIYDLVSVGTPVLVYERDFDGDRASYEFKKPPIYSRSYLAADLTSNFVLLEKNSQMPMPIASITKLMTALTAIEHINLDLPLTVPAEAIVQTSKPRLKAGQSVTAFNLLYPLLLESSNEAAETFAAHLGRDRFVSFMNEKARALGMNNTRFVGPSGAEAENVSTAQDLFNLLKYINNNRSFILELTAGRLVKTGYGTTSFADLGNFNYFGDDQNFVGGKSGLTEAAGETMASVFRVTIGPTERRMAIIILGSVSGASDTATIRRFVETNYAIGGDDN